MTGAAFRVLTRRLACLVAAAMLAWGLLPQPGLAQTAGMAYQVSLVREGDLVALGGSLPDEAAREAVLGAIRSVSPDLSVIDMTALSDGAPAGFEPAAVWAAGIVARLKPGAVLVSGTEVTVEGRPEGLAGQAAVAAALAARPAGYTLVRSQVAPPVVRPFLLSITRGAGGLSLLGVVASEDEKAGLIAFARSLALGEVRDDLAVAEGAPAGIDRMAAARFALLQLVRLSAGTARIEDGTLALDGEAADRPGFAAVSQALRAGPLPGGVSLKAATIAAPAVSPYRWTAEKTATGLRLQGYVPSEAVHASIVAAAGALFAPLTIADEQVVARGAPDGFETAAVAAMGHLVLLERGRASLTDSAMAIAGEAASPTAAAAAGAAIEGSVPFGFTVSHALSAPEPPAALPAAAPARAPATDACVARVSAEMAAGGIAFQFGRDAVRPDSLARLRRIAEAMKACPSVRFAIEGHTDSDGVPAQNVDLSHRRAQAVVAVLMRQGIDAGRLLSEGHGASRPLVPNDSPANKARNRRIEIIAR